MTADRRPPGELDSPIWRASTTEEVNAELEFHVEMLTRDLVAEGMPLETARVEARRRFGDLQAARLQARQAAGDRDRAARRASVFDALASDARFALRQLRRSPGFAVVAVLTLALGIGANSAIFSVINGVVLKPLPYPAPDALQFVTSQFPTLGFDKFWVSPPEFFEYQERTTAFGRLGAYTTSEVNLSDGTSPERVNAAAVTAGMFDVLGVGPVLGRTFTADEDLPNAERVAVLSHGLWQRSFGGERGIVGRRVSIQGHETTVLGVMPPGFDLHDARADVWLPLRLDPANRENRGSHFLYVVGRLAPGATPDQAQAELRQLLANWSAQSGPGHVPNDSTHRLQIAPLRDEVIGDARTSLWVLQGAVGLVLLIACANMANLLLARAESRHKEFAVRATLGAGRARILRLFLVEGVVLALLGGVVGLVLAWAGLRLLLARHLDSIPRAAEVGLDPTVVAFTVGVAVLTGLVFALAPLLHLRERTVVRALRDGGARSTSTAAQNRVRAWLVGGEIALAVMLVIGAGLLLRSFRNLTTVDAGFDRSALVTFALALPQATYEAPERRAQFFTDLVARLRALPGVAGATAMSGLPPQREVNANDTDFEGRVMQEGMPIPNVDYYQTASVSYFDVMGIPMVEGRGFTAADAGGPPVAVVNETLARTFYPEGSPLGRRIRPGSNDTTSTWFTIVGIAKDVKQGGLSEPAGTELYLAAEQLPRHAEYAPNQMHLVLRTTRSLDALAPEIRRAVAGMDPALPIVRLRTMDAVFDASLSRQRLLSQLLGAFAAVALLLAAVGTYGILSYMVSERTREIGIRMALGADQGRVVGLVLRRALLVSAAGIAIGIAGALALGRLTSSLLFGVSPADPTTFAAVAGVIALVSLLACAVPARRATRVDPLVAMRAD